MRKSRRIARLRSRLIRSLSDTAILEILNAIVVARRSESGQGATNDPSATCGLTAQLEQTLQEHKSSDEAH